MSHPYEIREYRYGPNDKPRYLVVNTRYVTRTGQPIALTIYNTREDAQRCIDCWTRRLDHEPDGDAPLPLVSAIRKSRAFSFT